MADIFLSYARADQPIVEKLVAALEQAGFSVWWDDHLRSGARFAADIEQAIADARFVLVGWSAHSVRSRWVSDEASAGADANKLVSLSLDGTAPPMGFRQFHATDMSGWKGGTLPRALIEALDAEPQSPSPAPEPSPRRLLVPMLVAGLLLIGGAAWWFTSAGDHPAAAEAANVAVDRSKSVAVLPFENLAPGGEYDWFAPALTSQITSALGGIPDILVAAPGAAAGMAGQSPDAITQALDVNHVLEGTVLIADAKLRVSVSLADASGRQVWANQYDRSPDDLLAVQEDIARNVANAMGTVLDPEELRRMAFMGTRSVDAMRLMQQGLMLGDTGTKEGIAVQLGYFDQALAEDPQFSFLHALYALTLAERTRLAFSNQYDPAQISAFWQAAVASYDRALETATRDIERVFVRQNRAQMQGNVAAALKEQEQLARDNPLFRGNFHDLAILRMMAGDRAGSRAALDRFVALDGDPEIAAIQALMVDQQDRAVALADEQAAINPDYHVLALYARIYQTAGLTDKAAAVMERIELADPGPEQLDFHRAVQACAEGRPDVVRTALASIERPDYRYLLFKMLGRNEEARAQIRQADRARPPFSLVLELQSRLIDVDDAPNLKRALERDGITPPTILLPSRCPERRTN